MKTKLILSLVLGVVAVLSGAGCTSLPGTVKALAGSKAIAVVKIGSVYGTASYVHIGMTNAEVSVAPDGTVTIGARK